MAAPIPSLPALLSNDPQGPHSPLLVVSSSSHSLSPVPVIGHCLSLAQPVVLVAALFNPRKVGWRAGRQGAVVDLRGWTEGFDGGERDGWGVAEVEAEVWKAVKSCSSPPVVVLDSPTTLASNLGSASQLALLVGRLVARLTTLGSPSLLVVPVPAPVTGQTPLLPLLTPTTLSPTLTHLHLLPSPLVALIHSSYALLPPAPRWFNILASVTSRGESDSAACAGGWADGVVVAVERRGRKGKDGVARSVEGLRGKKDGRAGELEGVRWEDVGVLSELKAPPPAPSAEQKPQEPTPQSSFNLDLTPSQRSSRSAVPIPYAHEGEASPPPSDGEGATSGRPGGGIIYEPDEGDDMDEDDPDEDLEF